MVLRLFPSMTLTVTIPSIRIPGSTVVAANELRKKIAAEMSSNADPVTCMTTSALRERPGRTSGTTSPRMARTSSTRVAWRAGASAKNRVEMNAAITRNSATRQSAAGTSNRRLPSPGGKVVTTA